MIGSLVILVIAFYSAVQMRTVTPPEPNITTSSTTTSSTFSSTTTSINVLQNFPFEPKLTLLFLPVNWSGGMANYSLAVAKHTGMIISNIPLRDCPGQVRIIQFNSTCNVGFTRSASSCNTQKLNAIAACARSTGIDYDYAIGITDLEVCGNVEGYSENIKTVFAEVQFPLTTIHELGHEWGLNDEYINACVCRFGLVNPDSNCLDASLGGSAPLGRYSSAYCAGGTSCPARYVATCQGNIDALGGRCIMSYANAPEPRAFCMECYNYLLTLPEMNCDGQTLPAASIISVDLGISNNDSVNENLFRIQRGRPTSRTVPGDYKMEALGAGGEILANWSIGLSFARFKDPAEDMNVSQIILKMRYTPEMKELRLYHKASIIYSRKISPCNLDGICDPPETSISCPQDCPPDGSDGICDPELDGFCDPDCMEGVDADCNAYAST